MKHWIIFPFVLLFILLVAGCSQPLIKAEYGEKIGEEAKTPEVKQPQADLSNTGLKKFTVRATKYHFDHQEIRVNQGDTVEITLENDKGYHTLKIEGYNLEVKKNRPITFVASEKGEFVFRCGIMCGSGHEEMTGRLIVE